MDAIERVIEKAKAEGNTIEAVTEGWDTVRQVSHMQADISETLWADTKRDEPRLRSWTSEATPHNRAERGFTDDVTSTAVSFPRKTTAPG